MADKGLRYVKRPSHGSHGHPAWQGLSLEETQTSCPQPIANKRESATAPFTLGILLKIIKKKYLKICSPDLPS